MVLTRTATRSHTHCGVGCFGAKRSDLARLLLWPFFLFFTVKSNQECEAEAGFKPGRQSSVTAGCTELSVNTG